MRKHVQRLLNAQRDLLKPEALGAVRIKIAELNEAIAGTHTGKIRIKTEELQFAAEKWIKPYPHAVWRENVEVLLVALAVAMGIRTFFLQPFKIPTGSMQPTLWGVTSTPDFARVRNKTDFDAQMKLGNAITIPPLWQRVKDWFGGVSYIHIVAPADGTIESIQLNKKLIFNIWEKITIGGVTQTIWFPPDFGEEPLEARAGLRNDRVYHKGEDVVKMKVHAGDHLFVDRLTYNFRKPARGDIVVFATRGIPEDKRNNPPYWTIPPNEFYIKRLCGLSGETISIHQDYVVTGMSPSPFNDANVPVGNLIVNGKEITADTSPFQNLYSFYGASLHTNVIPYIENHYYGHAMIMGLSPGQEVHVQPDHLFVMGDNTMNSLDSRFWGDFPARSVIGKSFFIYWPITRRFGLSNP